MPPVGALGQKAPRARSDLQEDLLAGEVVAEAGQGHLVVVVEAVQVLLGADAPVGLESPELTGSRLHLLDLVVAAAVGVAAAAALAATSLQGAAHKRYWGIY